MINALLKKLGRPFGIILYFAVGLVMLTFLAYASFLYFFGEFSKEISSQSKVRDLEDVLFTYANDHDGKYPEGKSSTAIFQKLMDGGYLVGSDSGNSPMALLYYPMPDKVQSAPGTKVLKPENVCWDVTCPVDNHSPDLLPLVFLTGFKVSYQAAASAVPLLHPARSWSDWWQQKSYPTFIAVNYLSNECIILKPAPNGTIPNFVSPNFFDPSSSKTYLQLTPNGELPP